MTYFYTLPPRAARLRQEARQGGVSLTLFQALRLATQVVRGDREGLPDGVTTYLTRDCGCGCGGVREYRAGTRTLTRF